MTRIFLRKELQADLMRQERIRLRVAMLEAADRNATAAFSSAVPTDSLSSTNTTLTANNMARSGQNIHGQPNPDASPHVKAASTGPTSLSKDAAASDQPEPWVPQVARRARSG